LTRGARAQNSSNSVARKAPNAEERQQRSDSTNPRIARRNPERVPRPKIGFSLPEQPRPSLHCGKRSTTSTLPHPRCAENPTLRVSCVPAHSRSLLLASGAAPTVAQKQLRHSDARMTLGIYGHIIGNAHREAVEKEASILNPTVPNLVAGTQSIQ